MIPKLPIEKSIKKLYRTFISELKKTDYAGEICTHYGERLVSATDNSIYQVLPQAILYPKTSADIASILTLANEAKFHPIKFTPRGGGTGTDGQSLNTGFVIDCSKHMNQILELNLKEAWVRVGPGMIRENLNAALKPHGFFFAPHVSSGSRATLGGMASTDGCGKGSLVYGNTSQHVLELQLVSNTGECHTITPTTIQSLETIKLQNNILGTINQEVYNLLKDKQALIEKTLPKLHRAVTAYNIKDVIYKDQLNLIRLICGSEGTLGVITELKLKILTIPKNKCLVLTVYDSFDAALSAAPFLASFKPSAIETIDDKILALARQDIVFHQVQNYFQNCDAAKAMTLTEFESNDEAILHDRITELQQALKTSAPKGLIHTQVATCPKDISALWELRKKSAGLLGKLPGNRKPVAFISDTAVPPENLPAYVRDFRKLLDSHHLEYGMFGHIDIGCLHVRPALDLKNPADEKLFQLISKKVNALVIKHQGVLWGEHGQGFRGEYAEAFFGPELYPIIRKIKTLFDPRNQLNPGKIAVPYGHAGKIQKISDPPLRAHFDKQITKELQNTFLSSLNCNGNAACFNESNQSVICPSWLATKDRIHSPKGRTSILREWLRVISQKKFNKKSALFKSTPAKSDLSKQTYDAMSGCLGCKACATECPIQVDIPEMKAQFLNYYHSQYKRPHQDKLLKRFEKKAKRLAKHPRIANFLLNNFLGKMILEQLYGLMDLPKFSTPKLKKQLKRSGAIKFKKKHLHTYDKSNTVFILQDPVTSFHKAELVVATQTLLSKLGFNAIVLPIHSNGKILHVKGFLKAFQKTARKTSTFLNKIAQSQIPIVGIEPSITLSYRHEYQKVTELNATVELIPEFLAKHLDRFHAAHNASKLRSASKFLMIAHCTEKSLSPNAFANWQEIFKSCHLTLEQIHTGCCGMAGSYGHEKAHQKTSKKLFDMHWQPHMKQAHLLLTDGFSCQSQAKRFAKQTLKHPVEILLKHL